MIKFGDKLIAGLQSAGVLNPSRALPDDLRSLQNDLNSLWDDHQVMRGWLQTGQSRIAQAAVRFPFTPIYSEVLAVDTASITIPMQNPICTHLIVTGSGRTTATPANATMQSLNFTFNGDTGTNYKWAIVYGNGSGPFGAANDTQSNLPFGGYNTDNCPAGSASSFFTFIPHYRGGFWKSCISIIAAERIPGAPITEVDAFGGTWKSTAVIEKMTVVPGGGLGGSLKAGSILSVYGIL